MKVTIIGLVNLLHSVLPRPLDLGVARVVLVTGAVYGIIKQKKIIVFEIGVLAEIYSRKSIFLHHPVVQF